MHAQLDPILATQLGVVSRRQTWNAGVTSRQLDRLLEQNLLVPMHRGVFRDPAAPISSDQRAMAAVLAAARMR